MLMIAVAAAMLALAFSGQLARGGDECWHYDGHGDRTWYDESKPGC